MDVAMLNHIAEMKGLKIRIVDPSYQLTEQDKKSGIKFVAFQEGEVDEKGNRGIGHYSLFDGDGKIIENPQSSNGPNLDCGYEVISMLTGDSVEKLREEVAKSIEQNGAGYLKAKDAMDRLQKDHPK